MQTLEPNRIPLTQLRVGQRGVVSEVDLEDRAVLSAMGLSERAEVKLCRMGEPCIVAVGCACSPGACRIGLSRKIADRVYVTTGG